MRARLFPLVSGTKNKRKFENEIQKRVRDFVDDYKTLRGTSQKEIAKALGWDEGHLSHLLTGRTELKSSHILDLARHMKVSPVKLLGGVDFDHENGQQQAKVHEILQYVFDHGSDMDIDWIVGNIINFAQNLGSTEASAVKNRQWMNALLKELRTERKKAKAV